MNGKLVDRLVAGGVFVYALVVYLLTMAPTASFWDAGEFIAIAHGLQVSHPPGAPFFMLLGRFFSMFAPDPTWVAWAVNLVSVVASAATVLLTHLVVVRLVRVWKGHPDTWSGLDRLGALSGGVVGALTFAVTDSFWFNAVEAEVYALSMLFTAAVVWLTLRWREETLVEEAAVRARGEHPFGLKADRNLLVIAYLFGLAIGVHLLNVLTLFFIAMIVFFAKFERPEWTTGKRLGGVVAAGLGAAVLFFLIYPGIVQKLPEWAGDSGFPVLFVLAFVGALVYAVVHTQRRRMPLGNLLALSAVLILIGYSSYALIFIRSAANPPLDENDPETTEAIVSYLKREQYGSTPLLSGTSYTGEEKSFPRRWSPEPSHATVYNRFSSDGEFFWKYQIGHMYVRYFLWNFAGKAGDYQDAAWISGLRGDRTETPVAFTTPSQRASRNAYFGLPLLLGLIGMAFHTVRDPRRAFAVLVLFLVTGVGIVLYLNQPPNQPRERDYSYVASFFAFSLWIGLGATGLVEGVADALGKKSPGLRRAGAFAVAGLVFVAVPGWMLVENYHDHDRTGRYLAPDFARNMLESTAPNAILFTNGDNDTFPLWYLQEVEGVRRDVRVVNLSLLNTTWYIRQLRDQWSRESAPLPMSLTDAQIAAMGGVTEFAPSEVTLPVRSERFQAGAAGLSDTAGVGTTMSWQLNGRPHPYDPAMALLYTADRAVLDIIAANAEQGWTRPIYFASTVSRDSELDLQPFFQNEGLARRVLPVPAADAENPDGRVDPAVTLARFARWRFTNLADSTVYYDENERNLADTYRSTFATAATAMAAQGRTVEARQLMDRIRAEVPFSTIPADFYSLYTMAEAASALDDDEAAAEVLGRAERLALAELNAATGQAQQERAMQYVQFVQSAYLRGGDYAGAAGFLDRLATALGDPSVRQSEAELRRMTEAMLAPEPTPSSPAPPAGSARPADTAGAAAPRP